MNVETAISEFLLSCAADQLRPATIKWYRSVLAAFAADFQGREIDAITAHLVRQYIVGLKERDARYVDAPQKPEQSGGLSEASIAAHIRALRAFWGWCSQEYGLQQNPMSNVRRHKMPPPKPKAISPGDFVKLFNVTDDGIAGKRDRAILVFLADTGCRLGGLVSLTLDSLLLKDRRALVTEKGQGPRPVVFTSYTERTIRQWLTVRESQSPYVFISLNTKERLTDSGVNQMLRRLQGRAGVTGRVNPHSFRHGFAREYLRNGGDLATLARLLGHSDITTTASYYAVFSHDELAEFHEKFTPLKGLAIGKGDSQNV